MKMIPHQAVCERIRDGVNVAGVKLEEIRIVALLAEQVFAVVAAIVDVIIGIVE